LKKLRIEPSELCTDEEFLRRGVVGNLRQIPPRGGHRQVVSEAATNKREQVIGEIVARQEVGEGWGVRWGELFEVRAGASVSYKPMLLYFNWLQDKVARNVPVNEWVQELIGASGGTLKNPATNFYQGETDLLKVTENVAQVFMGMRIQCAQCHNHPFDRWT